MTISKAPLLRFGVVCPGCGCELFHCDPSGRGGMQATCHCRHHRNPGTCAVTRITMVAPLSRSCCLESSTRESYLSTSLDWVHHRRENRASRPHSAILASGRVCQRARRAYRGGPPDRSSGPARSESCAEPRDARPPSRSRREPSAAPRPTHHTRFPLNGRGPIWLATTDGRYSIRSDRSSRWRLKATSQALAKTHRKACSTNSAMIVA